MFNQHPNPLPKKRHFASQMQQWCSRCLPWHHQALETCCISTLGRELHSHLQEYLPREYQASSTPTSPSARAQHARAEFRSRERGRCHKNPKLQTPKANTLSQLTPRLFSYSDSSSMFLFQKPKQAEAVPQPSSSLFSSQVSLTCQDSLLLVTLWR